MSRQLQNVKLAKPTYQVFVALMLQPSIVSEIGAVVKVVDTHLCGLGSIPG